MLSFNFNKKKEIGVKELKVKDKILIDVVPNSIYNRLKKQDEVSPALYPDAR